MGFPPNTRLIFMIYSSMSKLIRQQIGKKDLIESIITCKSQLTIITAAGPGVHRGSTTFLKLLLLSTALDRKLSQ